MTLPSGSCDCHVHVFGPKDQFPYSEIRAYTPEDASLDEYNRVARLAGLERVVLVQPSVYGTDNRRHLVAAKEFGENARVVVSLHPEVSSAEVRSLHQQGVRGVRVNLLFSGGGTREGLQTLAEKIAPMGWHMQLLIDVSQSIEIIQMVKDLPVDVVFDHKGHFPARQGIHNPGFEAMLSLLESNRAWVKLSAPYRISEESYPYDDTWPLVQRLIRANPERLVWASDWPHPAVESKLPSFKELVTLLQRWCPDEALLTDLLVHNPARLYDFPEAV